MRNLFFIYILLFVVNSNAQKIDCSVQTNEYQDYLLLNNFPDAYTPWEFVKKNCPKQSESVYRDGVKIFQYKIDNAKSVEEKEELVRKLLSLYDQFYINFPGSIEDFEVYKGMVLVDNKIESNNEIYQLLNNGFNKALNKVTSANAIYTYFRLLIEKNESGDKSITSEKIIEKYTLLNNQLTALFQNNDSEKESYIAAKRAINALADNYLNCDNLVGFYEKKLPENGENEVWLNASLNVLIEKCSATPLFFTMAKNYYSIKKSSQSSYYLAMANLKNRDFENAKKLFIESAELEENTTEKATKYYTLATGLYSNDKEKAKEFLLKSLVNNPKSGKSYLFLAELYTNSVSECSSTPIEKKALYYLAIETVKKAAVADPILQSNVSLFIKNNAPESFSDKEIKKARLNGKTMTIGCWINEKISFPK